MDTQQKQFDTALAGLTPSEKTAYTTANPVVGVGGVQQTFNASTGNYLPTNNVISSNNLTGSSTPYNLPSIAPKSTTDNLTMANNSAIAGVTTDASYTPPVNTAKEKSKGLLETLGINIQNQASDIATINNDAKLLEKKQKATQIATEVDQMDKAYRDEIQQAKDTFKGTTSGLQGEINRITDRYQNNRANLALTYKVAVEDYNGALEIANQKIQTLKDTNLASLELYKLNVDAIQNDLTESEKMQVQANIQAKQKQADTISNAYADVLKSLSTSGQNVPASVYSDVDAAARKPNATSADIYAAAGNYATNLIDQAYKQAQIDKMKAETTDKKESNDAINRISKVDPNSPTYIQDIMVASSGGGKLTGDQIKPISKALTVVGQIDSLQNTLRNVDTGPILGILKSANPYDVQAQLVKAQLQAIIPNLARGVYGEVGVLTDNDIANYRKTIGNLKSPKELNDLLLSMTLNTVKKGIDDQLEVAASAGRDVSGFYNLHKRLEEKVNEINSRLGITTEKAPVQSTQADVDYVNTLNLPK